MRRKSGQAVADGEGGGGGSIIAGGFVEDMGEVIGHGFLAEEQGASDLLIGWLFKILAFGLVLGLSLGLLFPTNCATSC